MTITRADGAQLETARMRLRPWCGDDFPSLATFLADDEVNAYRGPGRGISRDEAWTVLLEFAGQWPLRGYGIFAVEEKTTQRLIGWSGLWHPASLEEPELAWSLFPDAHGHGYAAEAATEVLSWANAVLNLPPLFSFVHPDNHPSRKLAERLGATCERRVEFRGQPRLFYRHRQGGPKQSLSSLST